MERINSLFDVIVLIMVGGLFGSLGQGIRAGLGLLKRRYHYNSDFDISRLVVNLLVGFALGVLTTSLIGKGQVLDLTAEQAGVITISGYAGGDVIERMVKLSVARLQSTQKVTVSSRPVMDESNKLVLKERR